MTRLVLKTPQAEDDLLEIFRYIDADNPAAADRFLDAAEATFLALAEMPGMGRRWASTSPRLANVRVHSIRSFRNYLVFYRVIARGIEVLHVWHGARDILHLLEDEP